MQDSDDDARAERNRPALAESAGRLLGAVATGDRSAFAELFDRFGGLFSASIATVQSDAAARDRLCTEAFASVWRRAREGARAPEPVLWLLEALPEADLVVVLDEGRVRLDSDVDQARASAYQVAGTASAVDRFAAGRRLLSQHAVGGLKTAVVDGVADHTTRTDAAAAGVELSGVSLQQVVAALGSRDTELEGVAS